MPKRERTPYRAGPGRHGPSPVARAPMHGGLGAALPAWRMAASALMLTLPLMALWLAVKDTPVEANGQTVTVLDTTHGPYRVEVRVSPPTPRVGNLHMSVVLRTLDGTQPVNDASVRVRALGPAPDSLLAGPVDAVPTTETLNWYDLNLALPQDGEWSFTIDISRDEETIALEFPLLVSSGGVNWGIVVVLIAALPLLVSAAWYLRQASAGRPARRPARRKR